jgi:predicted nucleotidyltransferase
MAEEVVVSPRIPIDRARIAEFCVQNGIRRLALFGSVLREDFGPESDVDVLVEFEPDRRVGFFALARLERDLGAIVGRRVDLRTAEDLSRYFRDEVVAAAAVQYEAGVAA